MHATWRCRHSGACCRAGWTIPIEGPAFERVRLHFGRRPGPLFKTGGPLPEGTAAVLETTAQGCVFYDASDGRLCAIHRELGPHALPVACRQFPRQALKDRRGVFVTLSHFCPTAAALLVDRPSFAVVAAPPNLRLDGDLEGLDALEALPPLLTEDLLTDLEGYDAWERAALRLLAQQSRPADEAIDAIGGATARIVGWRPGREDLATAVRAGFAQAHPTAAEPALRRDLDRFALAAGAVPRGLEAPAMPRARPAAWMETRDLLREHASIVRAYLGAKLFGNWMAYYGHGLTTVVEYLRICHAVLRLEALRARGEASPRQQLIAAARAADWLIVHLADVRTLASLIERT
jgi:hypothetical protein